MPLTNEQQAIRRERVTASTLPAFLGYSPYQSPRQEWERHLGLVEPVSNSDTEIGQDLEEGIAKATARVLGLSFGDLIPGRTLIHPRAPFLAATPDYLIAGAAPHPACGIQIKKHAPHMVHSYHGLPGSRGQWDNGLMPVQYELQCQIEMMVVGAVAGMDPLSWYLSAYFGGNAPRVYRIRRNEELQESLLKASERFWAECIDPSGPRQPPDPARWPWRVHPRGKAAPKAVPLARGELLAAPLPELPLAECDLPDPFRSAT